MWIAHNTYNAYLQVMEYDYTTLVGKFLLSVSVTVLYLYQVPVVTCAMDGTQLLYAKYLQVGIHVLSLHSLEITIISTPPGKPRQIRELSTSFSVKISVCSPRLLSELYVN